MHKRSLGTNPCGCTPGAIAEGGLWGGGGLQGCKRHPSTSYPSVSMQLPHIPGVGAIRIHTCIHLVRFVCWAVCKIAAISP